VLHIFLIEVGFIARLKAQSPWKSLFLHPIFALFDSFFCLNISERLNFKFHKKVICIYL